MTRKNRKLHTCTKCGTPIGKRGKCRKCYLEDIRSDKPVAKLYQCRNNCGNQVRKYGSLCRDCYDAKMVVLGEKRQADVERRKKYNAERLASKRIPTKIEICPNSPTLRHIERINSANIGVCIHCGNIRDYNKLQAKYIPQIISIG